MSRVRVGQRLQVIEGSGLDSGRVGVVIRVRGPGSGRAGELGQHSRTGSVAILRDAKGDTFEMFTSHLAEVGKASFREPWPNPLNVKRDNPSRRNWYPGLIAIGRDDRSYMAITVDRSGGTYGYDFPTLRQSFPVDFDPRRIGLFDGRASHDDRFKVLSGGRWTKPLPLDTRISFEEFERVTGIKRS